MRVWRLNVRKPDGQNYKLWLLLLVVILCMVILGISNSKKFRNSRYRSKKLEKLVADHERWLKTSNGHNNLKRSRKGYKYLSVLKKDKYESGSSVVEERITSPPETTTLGFGIGVQTQQITTKKFEEAVSSTGDVRAFTRTALSESTLRPEGQATTKDLLRETPTSNHILTRHPLREKDIGEPTTAPPTKLSQMKNIALQGQVNSYHSSAQTERGDIKIGERPYVIGHSGTRETSLKSTYSPIHDMHNNEMKSVLTENVISDPGKNDELYFANNLEGIPSRNKLHMNNNIFIADGNAELEGKKEQINKHHYNSGINNGLNYANSVENNFDRTVDVDLNSQNKNEVDVNKHNGYPQGYLSESRVPAPFGRQNINRNESPHAVRMSGLSPENDLDLHNVNHHVKDYNRQRINEKLIEESNGLKEYSLSELKNLQQHIQNLQNQIQNFLILEASNSKSKYSPEGFSALIDKAKYRIEHASNDQGNDADMSVKHPHEKFSAMNDKVKYRIEHAPTEQGNDVDMSVKYSPERVLQHSETQENKSPHHAETMSNSSDHEPWLRREKFDLTIWSSDFHISPIHDIKELLVPLGVKFIDKSMSGACMRVGTCAQNLRVLNQGTARIMNDKIIEEFYKSYKDDPEMNTVDAYVCFHPASLCEAFIPFKKPLLVIASVRYELAREEPRRWRKWNKNLIEISKDPVNVVGGNSVYDAEYIRYFTGINATVLQSYCGYTGVTYDPDEPKRNGFLLSPTHRTEWHEKFAVELEKTRVLLNSSVVIKPIRQLYPFYKYTDLVKHKAIIHTPYQISVMSLFEQYRMNIPLVFPSFQLMVKWQYEDNVICERTWSGTFGILPTNSSIEGVIDAPDPNAEKNKTAIEYWLKFADFYQWPHIIYFDSIPDLYHKLETTDFAAVSNKMKAHNVVVKRELLNKWKKILYNIEQNKNKKT